MKKDNVNLAIRLLKELGIYNLWLKERRKYNLENRESRACSRYTMFSVVGEYGYFSNFIDDSFCWCDTHNEDLWAELYDGVRRNATFEDILQSPTDMFELKKIIEAYLP